MSTNTRALWASGLAVVLLISLSWCGCSEEDSALDPSDSDSGQSDAGNGNKPRAADPPYSSRVTYPSGLALDGLVRDSEMTAGYPNPGSNPWGSGKSRHYERVGYFIPIDDLSSSTKRSKVTDNFTLNEYVSLPARNNDHHAYIDAEITFHAQELRDAWGGPLSLSSTFRSPEYNRRIGGSSFSRHQYGDAVDVAANNTSMAQDLYNLARFLEVDYLEPADLTISGKNNPWIHIDDRGWPENTSDSR